MSPPGTSSPTGTNTQMALVPGPAEVVLVPGGGLLDVPGFTAHGVHAGLKRKRRDVALILSQTPAAAAAVFTQNPFAAAPLQVSKAHLEQGPIRAIVCNAANANACTGPQGLADARAMAELTAEALGIASEEVLVASTGLIGQPLDMDAITQGIQACAREMGQATGGEAAEAITTTDTHPKELLVEIQVEGRTFHLGGIAKGSGMIHPNMATMLAFLATDAPIAQEHLTPLLQEVVDSSFNMISVDGDESTNDMVALLAGGQEGGPDLRPGTAGFQAFQAGLEVACRELAKMIAADGEGATSLLEVEVDGAETLADARMAARAVASSNLVKAAVHGKDPNWGRILAALGQSRCRLEPESTSVSFEQGEAHATVLELGTPTGPEAVATAADLMQDGTVRIRVDLGIGPHQAVAWGCDLTEAYVAFNSAYST